jgi:ATP-binding cassette subfamily B multidrug efflux pump
MRRLKYLNRYFLKYKRYLIPGILLTVFSNFFAVYPAKIVGYALDLIVETLTVYRSVSGFTFQQDYYMFTIKIVAILAGLYLVLALVKGIFMFFMRQTLVVMSRHIEYDLKNDIYAHYQKLDQAFFKRNNTGDLMTRISEDVSKVRMYVGPALMYAVNLLVMFILVINGMVTVSPMLTLYVLLPMPVMAVMIYFINSRVLKQSGIVQKQLSALSSLSQEVFSGVRVIKSYNRSAYFSGLFSKKSDEYKDSSLSLIKYDALFFPVILFLIGLSTLITVYAGGIEVMAGRLNPGVIGEFIIYVNLLTWPVASVGWVSSMVQQAAASQERINEFLHTKPEIKNDTHPVKSEIKGHIVFNDVSFTYPDTGIKALKNISFETFPGQIVGITGRTGSGKSTIATILGRLYDTDSGSITIDGVDIKKTDLWHLRRSIGYVPQEIILFSDTIAENISFGTHKQTTAEDWENASRQAGVYQNIVEFREKFETKIGERGVKLSGGQKQRISIARALINNPPILLFDDCLSAVDAETEENILMHIMDVSKGKTTFLISHKVSTLKKCDQILVLENGNLVETGTHQQLLNSSGYYARIARLQSEPEEEL